jgi:uncharacterized protein DUF4160
MTAAVQVSDTVAGVSPVLLVEDGFAFSFFSNENQDSPHVHVRKGGAVAKWWLDPSEVERTQVSSRHSE